MKFVDFRTIFAQEIEMAENNQRWSRLPLDVLEKVAKKLDSRFDVQRLRAVCSSWRSLVPLPPKRSIPGMPLKLPFPICPNLSINRKLRGCFILMESTIYCIEPLTAISNSRDTCKSWVVHIEEDLESGRARLRHPLSVTPIDNSSQSLPRVLNLLDYKVSEVAKCYTLEFVSTGKKSRDDSNESKPSRLDKVVISESDGCFAIMVKNKFTGTSLGLWRMGDKKWTVIDPFDYRFHFEDIAYHNRKFHAVYMNGLSIAVEPSSMKVTIVADPLDFGGIRKLLVKSQSDLFMIDKFIEVEDLENGPCSRGFEIFKLNEDQHQWIGLSSVSGSRDQAYFLGEQCCFSVSAREFLGCKKNSVYFTDICFDDNGDKFTDWDVGLFDIEEDKARALISDPCFSKIFWPPPTWLVRKDFGLPQLGSLRLS